jgi:hypothetical protein
MPLLLKASIKRTYAENLLNDVALNRGQYFLFVAKTTPWDATAGASADIVPVTPPDTVKDEYEIMHSVIGYKKLDPSKIVFALPRVPWEVTNYDAYEDDQALFDVDAPKNFYVVSSANNIYKCLKAGSGNSTIEPSHTSTTALEYNDGYTWKYLATVKESLLPYELTDYIPVTYAVVQQDTLGTDSESTTQFNTQRAAVNGQITRLDLTDAGGVSAATYYGSEYGARFAVGATGSTAAKNVSFGVGDYFTITTSTNTNAFSLPVSDIQNYVGYVLRIVGVSGGNPSDVNNYGIIHGVTASSNQYTFTVRGEHEPFTFTFSGGSNAVYYDIIPYARISGDGSGAYGFVTTGKTGASDWRKINGINLIDGGMNYSQASVRVVSAKADGTSGNTVHPTITAVLSPKGGHGSNILKELNVQDVIMVATIDSNDEAVISTGGSYRKFGIIRNPIVNDNSDVVAGSQSPYYRDLVLQYLGASYNSLVGFQGAYFDGSASNFIVGKESYATFPVVAATAYNTTTANEKRVQVQVKNSASQPITWLDRLQYYDISLSPSKSGFLTGEKVSQNIPAGISIGALGGITYAFGISAEGTVVSATSSLLGVRVTKNAFVSGTSSTLQITGFNSGVTATVAGVSLSYGEKIYVNRGLSLATEAGKTAEFFKIISASVPYFAAATVPSYSGLTVLRMTKPTGLADFTDTTWQNGDFVQQGVSGSYLYDYASGTVYKWSRTDVSTGLLYVTEPFGNFKYVTVNGATLSRLNTSGGVVNQGYSVAGVSAPGIDIHSGEIIYINSIQPIQRLPNQSEEFRLRVGF